jgi:hypothetical protein
MDTAQTTPTWICPACGYFCAQTWADASSAGPESLGFFQGVVCMTAARGGPFLTLCFHPDGSGSYGGAETGAIKSRTTSRLGTPEEAGAMLAAAAPATDLVSTKTLEDAVLTTLAGPIAAHFNCYVRHADDPETFLRVLDLLHSLPASSSLAVFYAEAKRDPDLRGLQDLVIDLLESEEDFSNALGYAVCEEGRHAFTPHELQGMRADL